MDTREDLTLIDFTLRKRGMRMEYTVIRPVSRGSMTMPSEMKEKSPFPPSSKILVLLDEVKPLIAKSLGLWHKDYDSFLDEEHKLIDYDEQKNKVESYFDAKSVLDSIDIITVSFNGGYRFIVMVETIPGKTVKMRSPIISEDDDLYDVLDDMMGEIYDTVVSFIGDSNYDVKAEAKSIVERTMKPEEIEGKTDSELLLLAIDRMEDLGAVIMFSEDLEREIEEARKEAPMISAMGEDDLSKNESEKGEVKKWAEEERDYESDFSDEEKDLSEKDDGVVPFVRSEESLGRVEEGDHDPLNSSSGDKEKSLVGVGEEENSDDDWE